MTMTRNDAVHVAHAIRCFVRDQGTDHNMMLAELAIYGCGVPPMRAGLAFKYFSDVIQANVGTIARVRYNRDTKRIIIDPPEMTTVTTEPKRGIMGTNSLPDAVLLAAEQAEAQYPKKFMVLDRETESGDILYGVLAMNDSVADGEDLAAWNIRVIIQGKQKR